MRKFLKVTLKIINIAFMVFLSLIIISNVYTGIKRKVTGELQPTVFGYSSAVVISGSMSGSIEVNDLIITHTEKDYKTGDIITFKNNSSLVTHRIIEVNENGFRTKGDSNNTEDENEVTKEQIVGKVVLVVPKVGAVIGFLQKPLGMLMLFLIVFLMIEFPAFVRRKKAKE